MKSVHRWIFNQIEQLERQLERCDLEFSKNVLQDKLEEAWEMLKIVSQSIDWDDNDEE